LPYYGVFDNLAYKVDPDGTVTLLGQVSRPSLKPDAEKAVKHIEGVEKVVNNIEVLPTSFDDDRIRRAAYRAIYGNSVLSQYQWRAVPPIHIIVKNGNITLEGVVARQMEKQIAGMQANGVHDVFSVTNNLVVEEPEKKDDKKKKFDFSAPGAGVPLCSHGDGGPDGDGSPSRACPERSRRVQAEQSSADCRRS